MWLPRRACGYKLYACTFLLSLMLRIVLSSVKLLRADKLISSMEVGTKQKSDCATCAT